MKKILTLIISFFFFLNAFSQENKSSEKERVNFLMVSLAKQYLEKTGFGPNDQNTANEILEEIKSPSAENCSFESIINSMKNKNHGKGADSLLTIKTNLLNKFTKENWKSICNNRKYLDDNFAEYTWSAMERNAQEKQSLEGVTKPMEVKASGGLSEIEGRIVKMEGRVDELSNTSSYIALLLSILSLLGVAYLFYQWKMEGSKCDVSLIDNSKVSQDDIDKLENKIVSLRKTVEGLKKQLEEQSKMKEEKQVPAQPVNSQPTQKEVEKKEPELRQSAPVQPKTVQKVYARPKSTGVLREAQDSSYFTIEIKNGKSEVLFTGDSMSAIKNQDQYFGGIYDIIDRSGTNKVVVEKVAVAEKQSDGTWMVTEKGKLRFK
ncbi:MAG: hypothetical protein K6G31_09605 [Paludibacteraceae bacterium]|nr:hypothetical protein [Paludibacteraceae bacterium]